MFQSENENREGKMNQENLIRRIQAQELVLDPDFHDFIYRD